MDGNQNQSSGQLAQVHELTFGEKAVGLSFNPSADPQVHAIKVTYADLIDTLNEIRNHANSGEQARLLEIAIVEAQGAQMWAVKAVTWKN